MWTAKPYPFEVEGTITVNVPGVLKPALRGALVDVFRIIRQPDGTRTFHRINQVPARTNATGLFVFDGTFNLTCPVLVAELTPSTPPYNPQTVEQTDSFPDFCFRVFIESQVGVGASSEFVDVYDERLLVDEAWIAGNGARINVRPFTGNPRPVLDIVIPGTVDIAVNLCGLGQAHNVPGNQFRFLRVGRATRDEIGELGTGKPGYMNSGAPSFFPGVVDAPFAHTLHIGGWFGNGVNGDIYYTVSVSESSGNPANPVAAGTESQILDPLFNRYYQVPPGGGQGAWKTVNLGPVQGTITEVQGNPGSPLIGSYVSVFRKSQPQANQYWPFPDLIALWNSAGTGNGLRILSLEAYERVAGGSDQNPNLRKLSLTTNNADNFLPLHIDNRPPAPKLLPVQPADSNKFRTGVAWYPEAGTATAGTVTGIQPMPPCNEMTVIPGQIGGNDCLLVRYSIEDGAGALHKHVAGYGLSGSYTPKAVPGAPDSRAINFRQTFAPPYSPISGSYAPVVPPELSIGNQQSVLVPGADLWPPEPNGDNQSGPPCRQYATHIQFSCSVRTVDGWGRAFGSTSVSRYIIVKTP